MSELSLGQFIKNAFNYSIGKQVTQQPTHTANENFQQAQQQTMKMLNETMQNIQNNFLRQADVMNTQMQLRQLNSLEQQMMLKDLFNFPKEMKDLMIMFAKDSAGSAILANKDIMALLGQNIDMSKLMLLLQTGGKNAAEKLTKLIQTLNQSGIYDVRQMKEMTALINACVPAADTTPAAMIKSLMIMYLPWLPLNEQAAFNMSCDGENEQKNADSQNVVTIIINTLTFGEIKAVIYKDDNNISMEINCVETFPKKEFQEILKSETTGYSLESGISFTTRKVPVENSQEGNKAGVHISQSSKVSPHLLLIIHTVINAIVTLDKKAQLLESRSSKMD